MILSFQALRDEWYDLTLLFNAQTLVAILMAYLVGGIPAFVSGWFISYFIQRDYNIWLLVAIGGCIGGTVSGLPARVFGDRDALILALLGALAGSIATGLVACLPGRANL